MLKLLVFCAFACVVLGYTPKTGPCPQILSLWTPWSSCSKGMATRSRIAECDSIRQYLNCKNGKPVNCTDESIKYGDWTHCNATCNGGGAAIQVGHSSCMKEVIETSCIDTPEPCAAVDCTYSSWSAWGPCEKCGALFRGTRTRTRAIDQWSAHGGKMCNFTSLKQTERCHNCKKGN
eukprot:TRINITY_DN67888_c1_g1_i1.p2 TRINITY_DN67888_c1_g1~~TRINITY_DN67888_c1_g1_i1.p2  ORF type:complete len:184 (+),score=22.44 TRINITY_DN67888_c1_g1_i1:23-553(+)